MATLPVIEKLLDYHVAQDGTAYYQVKWKPTWERADSLLAFKELIDKFWKFVNESNASNVYQNHSIFSKTEPVLPDHPPIKLDSAPVTPVTPKQGPKRNRSTSQTPRSHGKVSRSSSSKQSNNAPRNLNNQANVSSNQSFTNNVTFISQIPSSVNPQRSNIQSAVVIESDEEDEVLISNPNFQQNNPMQTNFQSGNHMQLNSPMQGNMQGMNQQQSNQQIQNNMQLNQFQGNVQFQNSNPAVANQVLPNGLNMFHPANRFMQNANRNQQLTMQNTIKTEASTQPLLSPSQIKQQPDIQFNNAGGNNTFQQQLTPTMGNPQQIQRSLSMPPSVNVGQQQPLVKSESVGIEPVNSDQSLHSGDSGELPADAKWQDYCETMESFIDGNRANVSFRCKICSSTIAQKSNFARHFNQHKGTPYECPICSKVLNRTDYIERHLKQHGVANPEKLKAMIKIAADAMKKK